MDVKYTAPATLSVVYLALEQNLCAGSDIATDMEAESAGILTEDFDFSTEGNPFDFQWEETL
jgi:hypothetical protein